nr:3701_t:CDS:2 [Entrophospora candida]
MKKIFITDKRVMIISNLFSLIFPTLSIFVNGHILFGLNNNNQLLPRQMQPIGGLNCLNGLNGLNCMNDLVNGMNGMVEDIEHHDTIKEECENLPSIDKTTFIEQPIVVVLDKTETRECEGELQEDCKEISDGIGDGVYNDVQQHIDEFTYPTTLPSAY